MAFTKIRGRYFDGSSPIQREVLVSLTEQGVGVYQLDAEREFFFLTKDIVQLDSSGPDQLTVTGPRTDEGFAAQVIIDHPGIMQLAKELQLAKRGLLDRFTRHQAVGIFLAANVVILTVLYLSMTPLSYILAGQISYEQEQELFDNWITDSYFAQSCTRPHHTAILDRLAKEIMGPRYATINPTVEIIDHDLVNAFAFPGGKVVLTSGFLESVNHPNELTGVLSHELAHVSERHVLAGYIRSIMLVAIWSVTLGDYSGILVVDPDTAEQLISMKFSRELEEDADRLGIKMLKDAGLDSRGLATFMETLHQDHLEEDHFEIPELLSTHPAGERRIAYLRSIGEETDHQGLTKEELKQLQTACRKVDLKDYQ